MGHPIFIFSAGLSIAQNSATQVDSTRPGPLSPLRGLVSCGFIPTAYAVGCILAPLCGWGVGMSPTHMRRPVSVNSFEVPCLAKARDMAHPIFILSAGLSIAQNSATQVDSTRPGPLSPLRGLVSCGFIPTACAVGCILAPLCGWSGAGLGARRHVSVDSFEVPCLAKAARHGASHFHFFLRMN